MNSVQIFICLFVISQCYFMSTVDCACCGSYDYKNCPGVGGSAQYKCGDCTDGTPNCGYGKCNLFGCACAGGCRTGKCDNCPQASRRKRDTTSGSSANGTDIVQQADKDQDGQLSVNEAMEFLYVMQIAIPEDLIREGIIAMDQNKDGFLLHSEIDPHN